MSWETEPTGFIACVNKIVPSDMDRIIQACGERGHSSRKFVEVWEKVALVK